MDSLWQEDEIDIALKVNIPKYILTFIVTPIKGHDPKEPYLKVH